MSGTVLFGTRGGGRNRETGNLELVDLIARVVAVGGDDQVVPLGVAPDREVVAAGTGAVNRGATGRRESAGIVEPVTEVGVRVVGHVADRNRIHVGGNRREGELQVADPAAAAHGVAVAGTAIRHAETAAVILADLGVGVPSRTRPTVCRDGDRQPVDRVGLGRGGTAISQGEVERDGGRRSRESERESEHGKKVGGLDDDDKVG